MSSLLSVQGLTLRKDNGAGSAILDNVSLDINPGEIVLIMGQSGSGKTTLLKCIAELYVYQSGSILLNGRPATSYGIPTYRTLVQYIPQRPPLLPGTPLDLLNTARSFISRQVEQLCDPLDLAAKWGIDKTLWMREWGTLSGGEGQRILLAIAIGLGVAEVILLDEPTSALDEETTRKVEETLMSLLPDSDQNLGNHRGPKALLWITHRSLSSPNKRSRIVDITRL